MPIKFSCPYCKKSLSVKDELAGKQGKCPGCKQVVIIPQQHNTPPPGELLTRPGKLTAKPPSRSGFDLEAMAAAALSEEKPAPVEDSVTVDFTCPWCDTEIHIPAEFAGKQAPCTNPECKRIVKVPLLKKTGPRDWRKADQNLMPSGAKRDDAPLEGAWDSQASGGVSRQALVQAAVIKEKPTPITVRGWIFLGVLGAGSLGLLIAAGVFYLNYSKANLEERGLQLASAAATAAPSTLPSEERAELLAALAEYYQRTRKRDGNDRPLGLSYLRMARDAAGQMDAASPHRPFVLRNLLDVQLRAVFDTANRVATIPGETQEKIRLQDDLANMQNDLSDTLGILAAGSVREDVIRSLTRSLLASGGDTQQRAELFQGLIQNGVKPVELDHTDQLNALGVLGQELAQGNQPALALKIAEAVRRLHKPDHGVPHQFIALLMQLNRPELEGVRAIEATHAGQAAGLLRADKFAEAAGVLDDQMKSSATALKATVLLDAVEVLLRKQQLDQAKARLLEAADILEKQDVETNLWERCRLLELSAAVNGIDQAEQLARGNFFKEVGRNRAQETLLRVRAQANPAQPLNADGTLAVLNAKGGGYGAVPLLLARQNGRLDPAGTVSWAEQLPDENARPFAGIGAVLGMGDPRR